jgi:hypothetical protein
MHDRIKELNNRLLTQNSLVKEKEERNQEKIELLERRIQTIVEQAAIEKKKTKGPKPLPYQKYEKVRSTQNMHGTQDDKKMKKVSSKRSLRSTSKSRNRKKDTLPRVAHLNRSDSKQRGS